MIDKFIRLINFRVLALIVILLSALVSVTHYFWTPTPGSADEINHLTLYNNFLLFKHSFSHLLHHQDLYVLYTGENSFDLYKYSPTFALLMAPFAALPDLPGLILWNIFNGLILTYALWKFPFKNEKYRLLAIAFVLIEAMVSIQNSQSNCLIAGLIILAFLAMEKQNIALSALLIVFCAFIKIFGVVALVLFLFYPNKTKAALWTAIWTILFALLPLVIASPFELVGTYQSWLKCLSHDYSVSMGFSVMAWIYTWFGIDAKRALLYSGMIIFLLPLIRYKSFQNPLFRKLFLASILIWVVIFNYKSESPTFVIAVSGLAIWFFVQEYKPLNMVLMLMAFVFTDLIATDIFTHSLRANVFIPYVVKVVPCILIWLKLMYDLLTIDFTASSTAPQESQ